MNPVSGMPRSKVVTQLPFEITLHKLLELSGAKSKSLAQQL